MYKFYKSYKRPLSWLKRAICEISTVANLYLFYPTADTVSPRE